ncbi:MAG: GtrA family protein [Paludibacter sp.]|nr:GtrA family protein [Paludibacter sp.]
MKKLFEIIGAWIIVIVDFFYPPFKKYFTLQFFRYGVTGVGNLLFDWILYFVIFNFILQKQMLVLGFVTLSSHIATLAIKFPITLSSGFLLQKYVTFNNSTNKGREQLLRYYFIAFINLGLNYFGLKLFVDALNFYPSIANAILSVIITIFSFFLQKKFTFKTPPIR